MLPGPPPHLVDDRWVVILKAASLQLMRPTKMGHDLDGCLSLSPVGRCNAHSCQYGYARESDRNPQRIQRLSLPTTFGTLTTLTNLLFMLCINSPLSRTHLAAKEPAKRVLGSWVLVLRCANFCARPKAREKARSRPKFPFWQNAKPKLHQFRCFCHTFSVCFTFHGISVVFRFISRNFHGISHTRNGNACIPCTHGICGHFP